MAIDNRLKIYDENENLVDYDIMATDVKFSDGDDLPTKLGELEEKIGGGGEGIVTGIKVGNVPYNPNTQGVVDLSEPFGGKVDKETGKVLIPSTDLAKLQGLPTADQLTQQIGTKANDAEVVKSISVNGGSPQAPTGGNVNIEVSGGSSVDPATTSPSMDGTAAVGSSAKYAREDHVHPHDTTKQDVINDIGAIRAGSTKGATAVQPGELAPVATSGSYDDLSNKPTIPDTSSLATKSELQQGLATKQDALTFDNVPTAGSNNPVKSGGIKTALDNLLANIRIGANGHWYIGQTDTNVTAQGPTGNVSISDASDILAYIVNDLTTGGGNNILSAEQGKILNMRLEDMEEEVINVEEDGFYIVDEDMNVAFSVTDDGIDAVGIGEHLEALVGKTYAGQCVVRFLPFLSAWNNAVKDSLCLCATKQQIVNNKIPFYDGFLFHKLPTDDKSLWYGTTLENAVQIGTVSFTPKNCLLAMSPTDGRVIATVRGDRGDIHVWDGTTDHTVEAVTSDGNNRKAMGWLYNSGVDFIKDGNNVERCIFAEYDGSVVDKGGFYVWVGTYPYTSASNWKTTLHKPLQYYGTIQDGTITHFHQVRRDPWTNILYLTSGDQPGQLVWWYSTDYGDTWTELTNNKTNGWEEHVCRLINFCFTEEWIYWATDHGTNHCLNRIKRNAQTGVIDPSTREKLCDLPFAQACNSICLVESPNGIFMYERIDTGTEYEQYYGSSVKMLFWSIPEGKLYTVAELGLTNNSWGGSRGKCYLNYSNGQQPRPAMGFSDDSRCVFDLVGADSQNIGTIFYEL